MANQVESQQAPQSSMKPQDHQNPKPKNAIQESLQLNSSKVGFPELGQKKKTQTFGESNPAKLQCGYQSCYTEVKADPIETRRSSRTLRTMPVFCLSARFGRKIHLKKDEEIFVGGEFHNPCNLGFNSVKRHLF